MNAPRTSRDCGYPDLDGLPTNNLVKAQERAARRHGS